MDKRKNRLREQIKEKTDRQNGLKKKKDCENG